MKSLSISLEEIQNIRFGKRGEAVIAATNRFGGQTYVTIHWLDIPKIVGPLLCCAATNARASLSEPAPGTIIPKCDLPVLYWQMEQPSVDGEPVFVLTFAGGTKLALRFPRQAAKKCGKASEQECAVAGSSIGAEP